MKLSDNTLSVLKNFASINSGIVIQKGRVQKTIHPDHTILVEATIDDNMPEKFGVYDLNQFLGNVITLNNPELEFTTESVIMNDGEIEMTYYSCSPNLVISPPEGRVLKMDESDVSFSITSASLQKLLKLANMNNLPNISVQGKSGGIYFRTHELKNDTSNHASSRIGDYDGDDFSVSFKSENLRLIPDDYDVKIKIGGFSCWTNKTNTLKYFIAMEKK
jgi:hypothetical protein